jgi:hypothetical protein
MDWIIWLKTVTGGGLFWTQKGAVTFHKVRTSSSPLDICIACSGTALLYGMRQSCPNSSTILTFAWRGWGESWKPSVKISSLLAKIWPWDSQIWWRGVNHSVVTFGDYHLAMLTLNAESMRTNLKYCGGGRKNSCGGQEMITVPRSALCLLVQCVQ